LPLPQIIPATMSEQTIRIDNLLRKLRKDKPGNNFISFANALPDHRLLPFNGIKRAIQQISRDTSASYLELADTSGHRQLREAIARRSFAWGGSLHSDDIIITNGATEALNLCVRAVTKAKDTVLVQEPCYYGVMQCLEFLDLKVVTIPCHADTGIDTDDLEAACNKYDIKACILVSNFNNPTGAMLSSNKKSKIAAFANKHKLPVIEDDLYGDLYLEGSRPDTIKTYDKNGWVLLCNSFSKSLFPGFRLGWCAPGRFGYEVARFKSMNTGGTANLLQKVLHELLHSGAYDRHLQQLRKELHTNLLRTSRLIEQHFPDGTKLTRPHGGIVLWVELPKHLNAVQLQDAAYEHGIGIAPGEIFSAKAGYKNYIRISYCTQWSTRTEKALAKLGKLCRML
jgi:DNA-binding transcriptional MocR family regulator